MLTIVCVSNNRAILEEQLLASLNRQDTPYHLIIVDNADERHRTAALVLNQAVRDVTDDYILFAHQDVALRSTAWLRDVEMMLPALEKLGAAGVAGRNHRGDFFASVWQGEPPRPAAKTMQLGPVPVQTLDGCLMVVPTRVFHQQGFDPKTCDGWYLYVADYCLDLHRRGLKVYVLPQEVYHQSPGPSDAGRFQNTMQQMSRKYRDDVKIINTTVAQWHPRLTTFHRMISSLGRLGAGLFRS